MELNMTMQRRHFAFIAETIATLQGEHREQAAYAFNQALSRTNPRFDNARFLKASKVRAFEGANN